MNYSLQPTLTLAQAYGPGRIYAPRGHLETCTWIQRDPVVLDAMTANQLCIAGEMPVICSAGAAQPAGLELLAETGLPPATNILTFRDAQDALAVAKNSVAGDTKLVLQHVHPADVIPAEIMWIPPQLLSRLNNKKNLYDFIAPENRPSRQVLKRERVFAANSSPQFPVVLKVPTDSTSGAGLAVAVCRNARELSTAADRFAGCEEIVVESFLDIAQNLCLHFVVLPDGEVRYLGHAEQDITGDGRYNGNWLELGSTLSTDVIDAGLHAVRSGAALGYRGIAGIDIAILPDKTILVLDLNFRINGSTPAVLLAPAIHRTFGPGMMHLRTFLAKDGFQQMISAARTALLNRRLLPVGTFDPAAAGHTNHPARLCALVLGNSREEILKTESALADVGLV